MDVVIRGAPFRREVLAELILYWLRLLRPEDQAGALHGVDMVDIGEEAVGPNPHGDLAEVGLEDGQVIAQVHRLIRQLVRLAVLPHDLPGAVAQEGGDETLLPLPLADVANDPDLVLRGAGRDCLADRTGNRLALRLHALHRERDDVGTVARGLIDLLQNGFKRPPLVAPDLRDDADTHLSRAPACALLTRSLARPFRPRDGDLIDGHLCHPAFRWNDGHDDTRDEGPLHRTPSPVAPRLQFVIRPGERHALPVLAGAGARGMVDEPVGADGHLQMNRHVRLHPEGDLLQFRDDRHRLLQRVREVAQPVL